MPISYLNGTRGHGLCYTLQVKLFRSWEVISDTNLKLHKICLLYMSQPELWYRMEQNEHVRSFVGESNTGTEQIISVSHLLYHTVHSSFNLYLHHLFVACLDIIYALSFTTSFMIQFFVASDIIFTFYLKILK